MPVVYEIDHARQRIHTRCIGAVTLDEVIGHFGTLASDPECPEQLDVLLDLRETTSLPTTAQLQAVATEIGRVRRRVRFRDCAVITSQEAWFGMARMFEVLAEEHFAETRVFRDLDEGTRWLDDRAD